MNGFSIELASTGFGQKLKRHESPPQRPAQGGAKERTDSNLGQVHGNATQIKRIKITKAMAAIVSATLSTRLFFRVFAPPLIVKASNL